MQIVIDPKSKPCPGVERAISIVEEAAGRGEKLFSIGKLIHNSKEVDRLKDIGLEVIEKKSLLKKNFQKKSSGTGFLIRAHGEIPENITEAKKAGMVVVDATCPIVQHSQEVIEQHVREGWSVIIVGKPEHPEVKGLLARAKGYGIVISNLHEIDSVDTSKRYILLAQSTIDKNLFDKIRVALNKKISNLKIFDTTCRFISNRIGEVQEFVKDFDLVLFVGGKDSSNLGLLYKSAKKIVNNCHRIEEPEEIDPEWLKDVEKIGIAGGASTPRWQMEDVRLFLDQLLVKKNPDGLINRKGGKFLWWIRKNRK